MDPVSMALRVYGDLPSTCPCPFTARELAELESRNEMLVYLPSGISMSELCRRAGIQSNVNFDNDRLIRNVMVQESHWFICSSAKTPELMYHSGQAARRAFEDEGLHGMDMRRYLAMCLLFRHRFDALPDQTYWCFLLSGAYDRSGISIVGFDAHGVLSHHGWMRNFKSKFTGARYVVLAPRIEIVPETEHLPRAYRGQRRDGCEAGMD